MGQSRDTRIYRQLNRAATRYALEAIVSGKVDIEQVTKRERARRENEANGLATCWNCAGGYEPEADQCPRCGQETIPF